MIVEVHGDFLPVHLATLERKVVEAKHSVRRAAEIMKDKADLRRQGKIQAEARRIVGLLRDPLAMRCMTGMDKAEQRLQDARARLRRVRKDTKKAEAAQELANAESAKIQWTLAWNRVLDRFDVDDVLPYRLIAKTRAEAYKDLVRDHLRRLTVKDEPERVLTAAMNLELAEEIHTLGRARAFSPWKLRAYALHLTAEERRILFELAERRRIKRPIVERMMGLGLAEVEGQIGKVEIHALTDLGEGVKDWIYDNMDDEREEEYYEDPPFVDPQDMRDVFTGEELAGMISRARVAYGAVAECHGGQVELGQPERGWSYLVRREPEALRAFLRGLGVQLAPLAPPGPLVKPAPAVVIVLGGDLPGTWGRL